MLLCFLSSACVCVLRCTNLDDIVENMSEHRRHVSVRNLSSEDRETVFFSLEEGSEEKEKREKKVGQRQDGKTFPSKE